MPYFPHQLTRNQYTSSPILIQQEKIMSLHKKITPFISHGSNNFINIFFPCSSPYLSCYRRLNSFCDFIFTSLRLSIIPSLSHTKFYISEPLFGLLSIYIYIVSPLLIQSYSWPKKRMILLIHIIKEGGKIYSQILFIFTKNPSTNVYYHA